MKKVLLFLGVSSFSLSAFAIAPSALSDDVLTPDAVHCKKYFADEDVDCAACAWYKPFSSKKVITRSYHIVCNDGTDYWVENVKNGRCGDC